MVSHTMRVLTFDHTGSDYVLNGGQRRLIFPANETRLEIPVVIVDDDVAESNENVMISFEAQIESGGLFSDINSHGRITITIVDNDGECEVQCGIVC